MIEMQIPLDGIFQTMPKSIFDALCNNTGYYIPAYQRPYKWDSDAKRNIGYLFDTICDGLFSNDIQSLVFFGSVVMIQDKSG